MKRTVELDTIEIADRLDKLSDLATTIAIAVIGLGQVNSDDARSGICNLAWQMSDDIKSLSDEVHLDGGSAISDKAVSRKP